MNAAPELVFRACPVCGEKANAPFLTKSELSLVRCIACSMIYVNPVARAMASGVFYDDSGSEYLAADKLQSDYADVRFERELRLFRRFCKMGFLLDVGCSSGGFLHQLTKRFPGDYTVLGTDVSKAPLAHAAKMGVPVLEDDFLRHEFAEKFDAVTFWAVMEHLFEPAKFLKKTASILKPGGLCFILVPNMDSLAVRMLGAKYRYIFPEHLNYFSAHSLKQFAELELDVVHVSTTHFNPMVICQDFRRGARDVPRSERAELLKRTISWKQSRLMLPLKLVYNTTEKILGSLLLADNLVLIGRAR